MQVEAPGRTTSASAGPLPPGHTGFANASRMPAADRCGGSAAGCREPRSLAPRPSHLPTVACSGNSCVDMGQDTLNIRALVKPEVCCRSNSHYGASLQAVREAADPPVPSKRQYSEWRDGRKEQEQWEMRFWTAHLSFPWLTRRCSSCWIRTP